VKQSEVKHMTSLSS